MIKHPAKYTDSFIPIFAAYLNERNENDELKYSRVLDPFGGTGKIGEIADYGYQGLICCSEIEREWAEISAANPKVHFTSCGDSSDMEWAEDNVFSAICTSPVYGNRISDHFRAKDNSQRITYRSYLGHDLHQRNAGRMNWGHKYRQIHRDVYNECVRVLRPDGRFILNISDHVRKGKIVPVSMWHRAMLETFGFVLKNKIMIETPRHRFGSNASVRVDYENIMIFKLNK